MTTLPVPLFAYHSALLWLLGQATHRARHIYLYHPMLWPAVGGSRANQLGDELMLHMSVSGNATTYLQEGTSKQSQVILCGTGVAGFLIACT
jgi:hypothetical protein